MKTFAELLTLYIKQAGITDTELARSIGVSRQTIFRWREGLTGRPNYREDVIAIAKKLRLSPDERDALLLAGGFRPDNITLSEKETSNLVENKEPQEEIAEFVEKSVGSAGDTETEKRSTIPGMFEVLIPKYRRFAFYIIGALVLIVAGVWLVISNLPFDGSGNNHVSIDQTEGTPATPTDIVPAIPGEILLVVTQFNASDTNSRITDQIVSTLQRESTNNRIPNIRIEEFPQIISTEKATQILDDKGACLIIYGESNTGLVTVNILQAPGQILPPIALDANDRISTDALSLIALAEVCIDTQNTEQAYSFLSKARNTLNDNAVKNDTILSLIDELLAEINNPSTLTP